jgi:hypothetical protein
MQELSTWTKLPKYQENDLILSDQVPEVQNDFGQRILAWQSETCPNLVSKVILEHGNLVRQN